MTRRFTVIQGGLSEGAALVLPSRTRLEAVGAALRQRLAELTAPDAAERPSRLTAGFRPIPAQAFLGIRPVGAVA